MEAGRGGGGEQQHLKPGRGGRKLPMAATMGYTHCYSLLQLKYTDYNQRWGDGDVLELVVMIVHDSEYTKITESCTF